MFKVCVTISVLLTFTLTPAQGILRVVNATKQGKTSPEAVRPQSPRLLAAGQPRAVASEQPDEYVTDKQRTCFETHKLVPCIKYKAAKMLWNLATNAIGYFPSEQGRDLRDEPKGFRRIRIVQLAEPATQPAVQLFSDARSVTGDSEWLRAAKFAKRSLEEFGRNHGLQLTIGSDSGVRLSSTEAESRSRHEKKKKKWLIILPLIILMKIAHLKMTMVTLLFGVLGLNVLLVGGMAWLIHYLKFKTLCKIHPHLVQSHSHVYDSDPAEYSSFVGSSFPGSYHSTSGAGAHEVNVGGYSKDWASNKAYNGYNYLDTISHRLQ